MALGDERAYDRGGIGSKGRIHKTHPRRAPPPGNTPRRADSPSFPLGARSHVGGRSHRGRTGAQDEEGQEGAGHGEVIQGMGSASSKVFTTMSGSNTASAAKPSRTVSFT